MITITGGSRTKFLGEGLFFGGSRPLSHLYLLADPNRFFGSGTHLKEEISVSGHTALQTAASYILWSLAYSGRLGLLLGIIC